MLYRKIIAVCSQILPDRTHQYAVWAERRIVTAKMLVPLGFRGLAYWRKVAICLVLSGFTKAGVASWRNDCSHSVRDLLSSPLLSKTQGLK
jgi:hypothetical protein